MQIGGFSCFQKEKAQLFLLVLLAIMQQRPSVKSRRDQHGESHGLRWKRERKDGRRLEIRKDDEGLGSAVGSSVCMIL